MVEITWEGQKINVEVKPVTYGEYKKIKRKSVVFKEVNGKQTQFRDFDLFDDLMILTCIDDVPFDKTIENIHKLSRADGLKLENAVNDVNSD